MTGLHLINLSRHCSLSHAEVIQNNLQGISTTKHGLEMTVNTMRECSFQDCLFGIFFVYQGHSCMKPVMPTESRKQLQRCSGLYVTQAGNADVSRNSACFKDLTSMSLLSPPPDLSVGCHTLTVGVRSKSHWRQWESSHVLH